MLINFTSGVFKSEKEMELYKFRWNEARDKYFDDLQANGLNRWASMQIWNKQGKSQLGWLFEYSDPDAYKKCQPIFIMRNMGEPDVREILCEHSRGGFCE